MASSLGDEYQGEFWVYCKGHQTRHHVVMNGRIVEYRVDGELDPFFASMKFLWD